jgi:hypothetical protein
MKLKHQKLYYNYKQKVDVLKALKQTETESLDSEATVLANFFAFLRSRSGGEKVVLVTNSTDFLPLLRQKCFKRDLDIIGGRYLRNSG